MYGSLSEGLPDIDFGLFTQFVHRFLFINRVQNVVYMFIGFWWSGRKKIDVCLHLLRQPMPRPARIYIRDSLRG